ncbi:hypothetical protein BJ165DRAFT_1503562 [Panaeolus papilionaceus]|nr:hypothetical protein BJ165DRAFT_1503562 [Panaeolus papilionaceus]
MLTYSPPIVIATTYGRCRNYKVLYMMTLYSQVNYVRLAFSIVLFCRHLHFSWRSVFIAPLFSFFDYCLTLISLRLYHTLYKVKHRRLTNQVWAGSHATCSC